MHLDQDEREATRQQDEDADAIISQAVREMARDGAAVRRARTQEGRKGTERRTTRTIDKVGQTLREIRGGITRAREGMRAMTTTAARTIWQRAREGAGAVKIREWTVAEQCPLVWKVWEQIGRTHDGHQTQHYWRLAGG